MMDDDDFWESGDDNNSPNMESIFRVVTYKRPPLGERMADWFSRLWAALTDNRVPKPCGYCNQCGGEVYEHRSGMHTSIHTDECITGDLMHEFDWEISVDREDGWPTETIDFSPVPLLQRIREFRDPQLEIWGCNRE